MSDFDRYSDTYSTEVDRALGRIGDLELFTQIKADAIVAAADELVGPPRGLNALDVGCGPGITDALLVNRFESISGVDIAPAMVDRAQARNPSVRYEVYDGIRLPFENGSFDVSFAICVFHHVDRPARAQLAAELVRVTHERGLVAILEHNPLNPLTRLVVGRCEFDADVDLLLVRESKRLLAAAGAGLTMTSYLGFFPWGGEALRRAERALHFLPLGAQYMVTGQRR